MAGRDSDRQPTVAASPDSLLIAMPRRFAAAVLLGVTADVDDVDTGEVGLWYRGGAFPSAAASSRLPSLEFLKQVPLEPRYFALRHQFLPR